MLLKPINSIVNHLLQAVSAVVSVHIQMLAKKMLVLTSLLLALLVITEAQAQELNCTVQVNDAQIDVADKRVFREMERAFTAFMNNTTWTDQNYDFNEKIDCNMQITINTMPSVGTYTGTLVIRAVRPVFNTSYTSSIFTFVDRDFNFSYVEAQPLDFNINAFNNNITSMLAFYAYMVVGMDNDSFEPLGGNFAFQQARTIAQIAQQQGGIPGWDPAAGGNASRNRGALIEGVFNTRLQTLRDLMYNYHRLGMDTFTADAEASRKIILENIGALKQVRDYNPSSILLITFFDSKAIELANMFQQGSPQVKQQAYNLLTTLDPSNTEKYRAILQ
ncbi:DUF4835 family protein [Cesiribacter sp. SM1]|uniref:type IX secretion system protein PorD n=1 Tax=Cesiribacter sp. SM1 TaxID=2861196 RepID=UPI001CD1D25F|nr:DUF4835 family protein [Cesiribacter sp. SM1]